MDFACRAFLWEDGTMTELNGLVHNPNAPFLENGNSINSRGQIAGKTTVQGTPLADAYLATPSPGEAMSENAVPAVATKTSPRSRVVSPEDVRRKLRQRLGSPVSHSGLRSATQLVEPPKARSGRSNSFDEKANSELFMIGRYWQFRRAVIGLYRAHSRISMVRL